jgi:single-stranded-DNA-specific exonuclease
MAGACLDVEKSLTGKRWALRLDATGERTAESLAQKFQIPEMSARVMAGRGIQEETAEGFLSPSLARDLPDPHTLKDMEKAAKRLAKAIMDGEGAGVFGDYDVDGATSSALLNRYFKAVTNLPLQVYIPDRQLEGYGPNTTALLAMAEKGAKVIITVDCGTLSYEPLAAAKKAGVDVIVADHHKAETKLPEAFAVINPNRLDEDNALGNLAAVGVVYLLIIALNRCLRSKGYFKDRPEPDLIALLDIVALGTVADVVALTGLNRTFVKQGLKVMQKRQNIGIKALLDVSRAEGLPNTYTLGFLLGPRVNAGGRVGQAPLGSQLLSTEDEMEAKRIALTLDVYNSERQEIEAGVCEVAMAQASKAVDEGEDTVTFEAARDWHPGVIGIVAGRLREKFDLPAFVFSIDDKGIAKGSARSLSGVDIGNAVIEAAHQGLIEGGGGHAMAAGVTARQDQLDGFKSFLQNHLKKEVLAAREAKSLKLDGVLAARGATLDLVESLENIGAFGAGLPGPRFALSELKLVKSDIVGKNHVRFIFSGKDGGRIHGVSFRNAEEPLGLALLGGVGKSFHIAGRLKLNEWMGTRKIDVLLDDAAILG